MSERKDHRDDVITSAPELDALVPKQLVKVQAQERDWSVIDLAELRPDQLDRIDVELQRGMTRFGIQSAAHLRSPSLNSPRYLEDLEDWFKFKILQEVQKNRKVDIFSLGVEMQEWPEWGNLFDKGRVNEELAVVRAHPHAHTPPLTAGVFARRDMILRAFQKAFKVVSAHLASD